MIPMRFAIIATFTVMYAAVLFAMDVAMHKFRENDRDRSPRRVGLAFDWENEVYQSLCSASQVLGKAEHLQSVSDAVCLF